MIRAWHAAIRHIAAGIALGLVPWVAYPPLTSFAMVQEVEERQRECEEAVG